MKKIFFIICISFAFFTLKSKAEQYDSNFVFKPVKPLIDSANLDYNKHSYAGVEVIMSNNGFALGGFYMKEYSKNWSGFIKSFPGCVRQRVFVL